MDNNTESQAYDALQAKIAKAIEANADVAALEWLLDFTRLSTDGPAHRALVKAIVNTVHKCRVLFSLTSEEIKYLMFLTSMDFQGQTETHKELFESDDNWLRIRHQVREKLLSWDQ